MADKPNVLIVMADQLTYALIGAYGHPVVRTPVLDRLCEEGVRFDAAYTPYPLCTPARAAMMTGRYASRTRTYDNASILPADVPTWAHHLRTAGYETVAAGKMHFVGPDQLHGLEARLTPDIYPADFAWTPHNEAYDAPDDVSHGKVLEARSAGPCEGSGQLTYDENVHARSLEFLRQRGKGAAADDRPFCLFVSYTHPHPPYLAPQRLWDLYEGVDIPMPRAVEVDPTRRGGMDRWLHGFEGLSPADAADESFLRRVRRAYYGMVTYVDEKVGELLEVLEGAGLRDNTGVIFLSDHGDLLGEHRLIEKRAFYDWSVRVPLIARFPRRWCGGRTVDTPVSLLDLFPTLTDLTGAPPPMQVEGRSFAGLLEGQTPPAEERVVISEQHGEGVPAPCFMVRRGRFKYIYAHDCEQRLFDLQTDPDELHDVAADPRHAGIVAELHAEILRRFDPAAIAADMKRSRIERVFMHEAMQQGKRTQWDYRP